MQVEHHEIGRVPIHRGEHLVPVPERADVREADALEDPLEELDVRLFVVDDEDPHGLHRRSRHEAARWSRTALSTMRRSSSTSTGFVR